ncbi:MAG: hypothetical protein Q8Q63_08970 [Phaeovulum sp.]|uniref:hypothetical protein n=1 Tax=Phaeovulum sp. TaxID=2934796 RepID=UPI0027308642|nr:hypothetical protein [Phaeovulum sp.]MDP2061641.1 hypothetical protein [Phaeovulum sp.]MDP3861703.1 hypothetical protein [Phaeovulum sp.]
MGDACLALTSAQPGIVLCGCLQFIADQELGRADQRRVAGFFADPNKAEAARRSTRPDDREFWARYSAFIVNAEALCRN